MSAVTADIAGTLLAAGVAGLGVGVGLVLGIALIRHIHRELDDELDGQYKCGRCGARFKTIDECVEHAGQHPRR